MIVSASHWHGWPPKLDPLMIEITRFRQASGRVAATFTATVGDLTLPGCALIRRGDEFTLSLPRLGSPSRPAPLSVTQVAALEVAAVGALRAV